MNHDFHPVIRPSESQVPAAIGQVPPDRFQAATALQLQTERYWAALRKRWWVMGLCLLLLGGPAVVFAWRSPVKFQSRATMWLTSKLNLPGGTGFFSEEVSSYMSTQAELMKSAAIQQKAFQKVRAEYPAVALLMTNPQPENLPFTLTIKTSPKNSVLNLQVEGPLAEPTQAFLDAVMAEYLQLKKGTHQQTTVGALAGITDQIKEVESQTKTQQEQLLAFEKANNISYLTEHGLSAGSHLARLEELLSDRKTELKLLEELTPEQFSDSSNGDQNSTELNLRGERAIRAAAGPAQSSDAAYYQVLQQLEVLKAKRDEFAQVLRPSHSKMVKLNQEISGLEQLRRTLKEEGGQRASAQLANRKRALQLQIESLETQARSWESNASQASAKLAQHERMKQDLARSQALYDRLLGLVQTVDLSRNLDQEPLNPLAAASAPRPVRSAFKIAAAGVFLSFVFGFGLLIALEALDDRFVSATELSYHLPEEVIGQIPETRLRLGDNGTHLLRPASDGHAFTESFRSLRSSLFFMFDEQTRPRVILLTSSVPKEGKSTVAAHLAASLAIAGSSVVLVDADLRRSSLHRILGASITPGLRDVLSGQKTLAQALLPVAVPAGFNAAACEGEGGRTAKLMLLPSGENRPGSAEILLSSRARDLFRELAAQYQYVIIDSPPMLATDDAVGLAASSDGVFVVVRAGYTSSRMVREALERLRRRQANILGLVYNRAPVSKDYYSRYSRHYHEAHEAA